VPPHRQALIAAVFAAALGAAPVAAHDWGDPMAPTPGPSQAIGSYAAGCLAGGVPLPADGPGFHVLRPQWSRFFGHPSLIAFLKALGRKMPDAMLIGDMAQPRGGPILFGHGSHQIGLDVDIWFRRAPAELSPEERAEPVATIVVRPDGSAVDPKKWTPAHAAMVKAAAEFEVVDRIFVHPAIKVALCRSAGADRAWLRKVRPWWGHDEHFHIRLKCPADSPDCHPQLPPPEGDGCGKELTSWFPVTPLPKTPRAHQQKESLPARCDSILSQE